MKKLLEEFATGAYTIEQARLLAFDVGIRTKLNTTRGWQATKDMLKNPLYAGFVTSDYIGGSVLKGLHAPIISEATYYRNQSILNGSVRNFSRQAGADWPLRGRFLKHVCGKEMTGSAPRGRSGPSPRYSCPVCKARVLGAPVSKGCDIVHSQFIELLDAVRPEEHIQKLFKKIVLREWNNELQSSQKAARTLDDEIRVFEDKKARVLDLFIDGKLSEAQKDNKSTEVDIKLTKLRVRVAELTSEIHDKEAVIDAALLFMSEPGKFWNLAPIEVKKRIQDTIFPEGVTYDCATGFGTIQLAKSYLLIKEIAQKGDLNPSLVAATGIEPVTLGL